jgi:glycolate oxidase iron-sulfur subunit
MREYGRLLGTDAAHAIAARVRDFSETVLAGDLPQLNGCARAVAYQAACHLRNVQRVDALAEQLLRRIPQLDVRRPEDELCCGAGGGYVLAQPEFARRMRDRKRQALAATGAPLTVTSNPGCMLHLEGAGIRTVHVAELVADALPDTGADAHDIAPQS